MFYEFAHRHIDCIVDGNPDKVILSRDRRSSSVFFREYLFNGTFSPSSKVVSGSIVATDDSFLVQSLRVTTDKDKYCAMVKTNAVVEVQRWGQAYDVNDNPLGEPSFVTVQSDVKVFASYVSARLRQEDIGLLPTTLYVLVMQTSVSINRPEGVDSPDRIIMNDRPYQVDVIDDMKYPKLYHVQLSEDRR